MGILQNTYSKIENGETKLTEERVERIADILETTVEVLKNFDERMVFNFNHHNQQGGYAGHITIHNAIDEIIKGIQQLTQPNMDRVQILEEKIKSLEKALVAKSS